MKDTGDFDESLGHQEEADYALRLRMAGWKCATAPEVMVSHNATATNDPAATERIGRGVVNWVNKWCKYFGGKNLNYHSPNVLRWEDWPPNALYLEEYWKPKLPALNDNPQTVTLDGREYDLIKTPKYSGFYRGRII
jgi:GT2 family glycosyltransferase